MANFNFSVDSALLGELGEKLVSTVHVALTELIKNAYDADAKQVVVRLEPTHEGPHRVVIDDDGMGMSLSQVRKYWMKIGTSNKAQSPTSETYGRLKTGSKGIGRFSCRRLGMHLKLCTTAAIQEEADGKMRNLFQTTEVSFNWADFKPGRDVEQVPCEGVTRKEVKGKTGTRLEIWGAKSDEWHQSGVDYLKRQLAALAANTGAARPGFEEDPGFKILLVAPGFSSELIDLRQEIMRATWGTLTARVDEMGRAECSLNAKGLRGTQWHTSEPKFPSIKGAKLELGILPVKKEEARKPELLSKYVVGELTSQWGGVQVRFNGFRMFPYGDPRDDWLEIERDRARRLGKPADADLFKFASSQPKVDASRVLLNMLSMRNYLGQVEVSSAIEGLLPRIDRQGFVENSVVQELRAFARYAIDWANIHRDHYIRLRGNEKVEKAWKDVENVLDLEGPPDSLVPKAAAYIRKEIQRIVENIPGDKEEASEKLLLKTLTAIEATTHANTQQLEHLRLVASASTLTLLFAHEVRTMIGTLAATAQRLETLAKRLPDKDRADIASVATQVRSSRDRFEELVNMTGLVGAFRADDRLIELQLHSAVDRAARCFQLIASRYSVTVNYDDIPRDIVVGPMVPGELYTVLLNLLSNAIKSVVASGIARPQVRFECRTQAKETVLRVIDNGLGLDSHFYEEVFTPFVADPSGELYDKLEQMTNSEDTHLFGTGSGLGLSIVRDVLRARGGRITFVEPPEYWSACVEVVLP